MDSGRDGGEESKTNMFLLNMEQVVGSIFLKLYDKLTRYVRVRKRSEQLTAIPTSTDKWGGSIDQLTNGQVVTQSNASI